MRPAFTSSPRTPDAERCHARLERRWRQIEDGGRGLQSAYPPARLLEHAQDVQALDVFEPDVPRPLVTSGRDATAT
jgi:hypothetical protein